MVPDGRLKPLAPSRDKTLARRTKLARVSFYGSVRMTTAQDSSQFSPAPIFLFLPLHRRASGVLRLEPVRRAARAIRGVLALRHDAFEAHLAGVREYGRAVGLDVFIEP